MISGILFQNYEKYKIDYSAFVEYAKILVDYYLITRKMDISSLSKNKNECVIDIPEMCIKIIISCKNKDIHVTVDKNNKHINDIFSFMLENIKKEYKLLDDLFFQKEW